MKKYELTITEKKAMLDALQKCLEVVEEKKNYDCKRYDWTGKYKDEPEYEYIYELDENGKRKHVLDENGDWKTEVRKDENGDWIYQKIYDYIDIPEEEMNEYDKALLKGYDVIIKTLEKLI